MVEIIKNLCKERNIAIPTLEKECGLKPSTIYKWDQSVPSVDKVKAVADYFGVSIDYVLGVEDEADPELVLALKAAEERPELRVLFSLGSKATKEDVEAVIRLLSR